MANGDQLCRKLHTGRGPEELHPAMLMRRIDHVHTASYADLYTWLEPSQLLDEPPADWLQDWRAAAPDTFLRVTGARRE